MSTFGREADRVAAQKRAYRKKLMAGAADLRLCVHFAIATLRDADLDDNVARRTALAAIEKYAP